MVSVDTIKQVIADQEQELEKLLSNHIINRELNIKEKSLKSNVAGIITGVRRCGKSVLAQFVFSNKKHGYINFEDVRLSLKAEELNKVLEAIYSLKGDVDYLIFDEIQNISGWEKFIGRIVASKRVIITGSNARLMSKELATNLVGRHIDFLLFPFSFREFLVYNSFEPNSLELFTTKTKARVINFLNRYMQIGGMPQAQTLGMNYLVSLYSDILQRDIAQRYNIKYITELKDISNYLMGNFSNEITFNKLKNIVNIKTANTISKWITYLENAYLLFRLDRFSNKLKDRIKAPKKIYAIDTGIACAVYPDAKNDKGRLMENIVAIELQRRIKYWNNDYSLYYWKDSAQKEVDFLLRVNNKTYALVQVTYASDKNDVKERELKSLLKAGKDQKCSNLIVITWDLSDEKHIKGKKVRFIPMWLWLINFKQSKII